MNPRRILVALALALLASGLCTWVVSRKLTTPPAPTVTSYVVPSRPIQAGEVLNAGQHRTRRLARHASHRRCLLSSCRPDRPRHPFPPGQGAADPGSRPLNARLWERSCHQDSGWHASGRAALGRSCRRGRFLLPGSHVDVLVTYRSDRLLDALTVTVLEDVVVLATGHQIQPDPEGKTSDVTIVTLLLTPEESQRAVLASAQGAIHFALRNVGDTGRTGDTPTLLSELSGRPAVAQSTIQPAAPQPHVAPRRHEIETVLATDRGSGQ